MRAREGHKGRGRTQMGKWPRPWWWGKGYPKGRGGDGHRGRWRTRMGKGRREVGGVEGGGVNRLGVCAVWSAWFFPKLITESIEIGFLIIRTDTYNLELVF